MTLLNGASADAAEVLRLAAAAGHRRLYIGGGRTIQAFLAAGLIDEITVTTVPVLLGAGIRLFGALPGHVPLRLMSSQAHPFGFVQSRCAVGACTGHGCCPHAAIHGRRPAISGLPDPPLRVALVRVEHRPRTLGHALVHPRDLAEQIADDRMGPARRILPRRRRLAPHGHSLQRQHDAC